MQGAWKVGLLVIVFVCLFIGGYAILGKSMFAPKTHAYYAQLPDVGGLNQGSEVQMAGVKVGTVSKIELVDPLTAKVTMQILDSVKIPAGSRALIPSSLIGFGQSPLQIVAPTPMTSTSLEPGATLLGGKANPLDAMLPEAKTTIAELNKTLVAARELLQDGELKGGVTKLLKTSDETLKQFGHLANRIDGLVATNQGTLQSALRSASAAMSDIQKSTKLVTAMLNDDRWKSKAMALLDNLNETTGKAQKLIASLDSFVNDPKLRGSLDATLQNTQEISQTGTRIASNVEDLTNTGKEIAKNGVTISEKAIKLEDQASEIAEEAKKGLVKLNGIIGKAPSTGFLSQITANLDVIRETKPNRYRTDVEVTLPFKDNIFHVGLFDAFESNKITIQAGKPFGHGSEFRYGVYASKPGIGVDFSLAPRLYVRGDLYDFNNPRGDIRMRYEFGNGIYAWLGLNQVLKLNAPLIGVGFRK